MRKLFWRPAAIGVFWSLLVTQVPAVTVDNVLADPAERTVMALDGRIEGVVVDLLYTVSPDETLPTASVPSMSRLKSVVGTVASALGPRNGVHRFRLASAASGSDTETPSAGVEASAPHRIVSLTGTAPTEGTFVTVQAMHGAEGHVPGRFDVRVIVATRRFEGDVLSLRRRVVRSLARALSVPPAHIATTAHVVATVDENAPGAVEERVAELQRSLGTTRLHYVVTPFDGGSRIRITQIPETKEATK